MSTARGGTRRFLRALSAMLLVTYSLPYVVGNDGYVAVSQQQQHATRAQVVHEKTVQVGQGEDALVFGEKSPEVLLEMGNALLEEGRAGDAVIVLDAAIAGWEEQLGSTELLAAMAASTAHRLGEVLALQGDNVRSAEAFSRAVRANEALFGRESTQAVESLTCLGLALLRQGLLSEAASALSRTLQTRTLKAAEGAMMSTGGVAENLDGLVRVLVLQSSEKGEDELAGALVAVDQINRLAWRYFVQRSPHAGEMVMLESLELLRDEVVGADLSRASDLVISAYLYNIGFLRLAILGEYESAASLFEQAHELRVPLLGKVHTLTVQAVVSRGWALTLTGETQLAAKELTSTARALLADGRPAAAERLLRQALQGGSDPLGSYTYAHACFTQHVTMLRSWGGKNLDDANAFTTVRVAIAKKAVLSSRHPTMTLATNILARSLMAQIEGKGEGSELLQLSPADKDTLRQEVADILQ